MSTNRKIPTTAEKGETKKAPMANFFVGCRRSGEHVSSDVTERTEGDCMQYIVR